jgi:exodeoxyribonuclease V
MLSDHIQNQVSRNFDYIPTPGQEKLIESLSFFVTGKHSDPIFLVKGFAGTGKTTLISALVKTLEEVQIKTLLLAPTGRAAKVFSSYAGKAAYTIHRKIYRQKSSKDGFGEFVLNKNLTSNLIILVDEASMISDAATEENTFGSGRLLSDLISYVKEGPNCKLILIGDTAQLPPVGISISPALSKNELAMYMPVAGEVLLTDIVRQNKDSGILENATTVRRHFENGELSVPCLKKRSFSDVLFIGSYEMTEFLEKAYSRYGIENVMIICRSNKRANQYNEAIRKQLMFRDEELAAGDLLMVVKNNYAWLANQTEIEFIANGDILKLLKIHQYTERYGFRFAYATLHMIDYDIDFDAWIMLDVLLAESAALGREDYFRFYNSTLEDYTHLDSRKKQYKAVREDPFLNALQVKYAYSVTCHKAQGGQWEAVFIDQGYLNKGRIDIDYLRWLYTAITRSKQELYFVNFPEEYIER